MRRVETIIHVERPVTEKWNCEARSADIIVVKAKRHMWPVFFEDFIIRGHILVVCFALQLKV